MRPLPDLTGSQSPDWEPRRRSSSFARRKARASKTEFPSWSLGAWELASRRNTIYTVTDMTELLSERITMDANICHGKPTIRGLRYPVENILEWLSSGMSVDEILADYEDLEREDIMAALEFASRLAKVKRIEMLAA